MERWPSPDDRTKAARERAIVEALNVVRRRYYTAALHNHYLDGIARTAINAYEDAKGKITVQETDGDV